METDYFCSNPVQHAIIVFMIRSPKFDKLVKNPISTSFETTMNCRNIHRWKIFRVFRG